MTPTYLAVTLGPIYRTSQQSKRTRMLWAGSYLFSHWMRRIVETLKVDGFEENILIPHPKHFDSKSTLGAGVYPDRCIVKATSKLDLGRFTSIVKTTVEDITTDITNHIQGTKLATNLPAINYEKAKLKQDLESYLQYSCIEMLIPEGDNILFTLYDQLDTLELRQQWPTYYPDVITHFLYRVNKGNSFLTKEAFRGGKTFESIVEIALRDLERKDHSKYESPAALLNTEEYEPEEEILDSVCMKANQKIFGEDFRQFHKYVAVVYADGDGISNVLAQLGQKTQDLKKFSETLIDFNLAITSQINDYGGAGIYLGGEDILMFLPVVCDEKCFFDLTQIIDDCFTKQFEPLITKINAKILDERDKIRMPTLSWGIAIQYYKHPIWDGLDTAHELMVKAKNESLHPHKNTIGIALRKHSGQTMQAFIQKDLAESYEAIGDFFKAHRQDERLLKSVTHKLRDPLFGAMLEAVADNEESLKHFFRNTFNESIHRTHSKYLYETLPSLIYKVYKEYPKPIENEKQPTVRQAVVYTVLRLVHFMNSKSDSEKNE